MCLVGAWALSTCVFFLCLVVTLGVTECPSDDGSFSGSVDFYPDPEGGRCFAFVNSPKLSLKRSLSSCEDALGTSACPGHLALASEAESALASMDAAVQQSSSKADVPYVAYRLDGQSRKSGAYKTMGGTRISFAGNSLAKSDSKPYKSRKAGGYSLTMNPASRKVEGNMKSKSSESYVCVTCARVAAAADDLQPTTTTPITTFGPTPAGPTIICPLPGAWIPAGDICFMIIDMPKSHSDAQTHCRNLNDINVLTQLAHPLEAAAIVANWPTPPGPPDEEFRLNGRWRRRRYVDEYNRRVQLPGMPMSIDASTPYQQIKQNAYTLTLNPSGMPRINGDQRHDAELNFICTMSSVVV